MSALAVVLLCALGFALLMVLTLGICCMFAPTEEELWPGEEQRRADALAAEKQQTMSVNGSPSYPVAPRRSGLRIVNH